MNIPVIAHQDTDYLYRVKSTETYKKGVCGFKL